MTTILLATGAVLLASVLLAAGFLAYRLRRTVRAWQARVRAVRSQFLPPGPRRDARTLRCRLQEELRCTRDMLSSAPGGLVFRADARELLAELGTAGAAIDAELRAVEGFADSRQQRAALQVLAPQAEQLISTSYTARQTLLRTSVEDRDRQLGRLSDHVAQQAAAAEIYRNGGRGLSV